MTRLEEGATVAMPNATALSEWVYPELPLLVAAAVITE
jgi:hypothetical protein